MIFSSIRKLFDISLGKKLAIYVAVFFVFPLTLAALIINFKVSSAIIDRICQTELAALKQSNITLSTILNDTEYVSLAFVTNDKVESLIKKAHGNKTDEVAKETFDITRVGDDFQKMFESRPFISSVCIYNGNDIYLQYRDMVTSEDNSFTEEASKLEGKILWTPVYELPNRLLKKDSPKYVISLVRAVRSTDDFKQIATERMSIDESTICKTYKDFNTAKDGIIYIVDAKGTVLSSPDKSMLKQDLNSKAYIGKVLGEKEGFFKATLDKLDYRVIHYKVTDMSWYVVQLIPEREMSGQIVVINTFIAICIAFCLIFALIFSYIQNRSVVKPLKLLAKEMEKVKKGDFDIHLKIKKRDEIGTLGNIFIEMIAKINDLINKVFKTQLMEREARLLALESQINPHFLYNTLDTIRWGVLSKGDYESGEQIKALSDIFRHVLNSGRDTTLIKEEIEHLQNYMKIQSSRFGDKIEMELVVDESLLECNTLKLILQPLVENSIRHGLECKMGNGRILVSISRDGDKVRYTVEDDGLGTDEDKIREMIESETESHNVFALKNIHDRIQLKYGSKYGLEFHSRVGQGTRVDVYIPYMKPGGGKD